MNPILGMLVFAIGGLAGATFLLPARGVKGWAYETGWMFYCVVGLLVMPTVVCALAVPDFWTVAMSAPSSTILQCVAFGAVWGVGGLTWDWGLRSAVDFAPRPVRSSLRLSKVAPPILSRTPDQSWFLSASSVPLSAYAL